MFALIGSLVISATCQRPVAGSLAVTPGGIPSFSSLRYLAVDLVATAGWSLVTAAAILRWRRVVAAGACLGTIGPAAQLARHYSADPSAVVMSWWRLVLAAIVALSAVFAVRSTARLLSGRVVAVVAVAAEVYAAAPKIESLGDGGAYSPDMLNHATVDLGFVATVDLGLLAAVGATMLVALGRLDHPVMLTAPQWAALWVVPFLAFAGGTLWLRKHERMLHRISTARLDADPDARP